VDGGGIDVDVDDSGFGRKFAHIAGDPVIETNAHGDEQIRFLNRIVRVGRTMHAEHFQGQRIGLRKSAQTHERRGDRRLDLVRQSAQRIGRIAGDDPAAGEDDRPVRFGDQRGGLLNLLWMPLDRGPIAAHARLLGIGRLGGSLLDIFGHIHQHRPRSTGPGDIKCGFQNRRKFVDILDQIVVFGDGAADAEHIRFLERVIADQMAGHLAGDGHQRDRIHVGRGQPGHQVGGTRPGGGHADAHLAGSTGKTIRRMRRSLFMTSQVKRNGRVIQFVENIDDHAAGKSESGGHALLLQGMQDHLCTGHRFFPLLRETLRLFGE